ncbi:MAG: hypothetical protein HC788_14475 [Sphingopyxis sp.]|nr:hypothetical protein [Sphingopyxis sp.]
MKAAWLITGAFAMSCMALAAEPGEPPEGSTPQIETATYCSATFSHLSEIYKGLNFNDFARKFGAGAQRWYLYAQLQVKDNSDLVLDRIEAHSQAIAQARFKAGVDDAQASALWIEDIAMCEAAEKTTFGNSFRQL